MPRKMSLSYRLWPFISLTVLVVAVLITVGLTIPGHLEASKVDTTVSTISIPAADTNMYAPAVPGCPYPRPLIMASSTAIRDQEIKNYQTRCYDALQGVTPPAVATIPTCDCTAIYPNREPQFQMITPPSEFNSYITALPTPPPHNANGLPDGTITSEWVGETGGNSYDVTTYSLLATPTMGAISISVLPLSGPKTWAYPDGTPDRQIDPVNHSISNPNPIGGVLTITSYSGATVNFVDKLGDKYSIDFATNPYLLVTS